MKTADEMFRELGYEKTYRGASGAVYTHKDTLESIEIDIGGGRVFQDLYGIPLGAIFACAQLIREMEGKDGK